jgi:hypothetical protein
MANDTAPVLARMQAILTELERRMDRLARENERADRAMESRLDSLQSRIEKVTGRLRSWMKMYTMTAIGLAVFAPILALWLRRRRARVTR